MERGKEGQTVLKRERENASQKTDGERNGKVKEINKKNERWAQGRRKDIERMRMT